MCPGDRRNSESAERSSISLVGFGGFAVQFPRQVHVAWRDYGVPIDLSGVSIMQVIRKGDFHSVLPVLPEDALLALSMDALFCAFIPRMSCNSVGAHLTSQN